MPRLRGGRNDRGFRARGRGRRGGYQDGSRRGQNLNLPPSHSLCASTHYLPPNLPTSNQSPGAVPTQGNTVNNGQQSSSSRTDPTFAAKSSFPTPQPGNFPDVNPDGVNTLPSQNPENLAAGTSGSQNVSPGGIPSLMQPLKHSHSQQEHEQVDKSLPESSQMQQKVTSASDSDFQTQCSDCIDSVHGGQSAREGSTSPVDLYLYGPDYESNEPESILGKRKDPPLLETDSVGGRDDGEGKEAEGGTSGEEQKDGKKKAKVGVYVHIDIFHVDDQGWGRGVGRVYLTTKQSTCAYYGTVHKIVLWLTQLCVWLIRFKVQA